MWKDVFALMGVLFLMGVIILACIMLFEAIKDGIHNFKRWWQYKHRFDKPPTAKCYCIDCKWHNNDTNRCYKFHADSNRRTADTCFCSDAEPRKEIVEMSEQ